MRILQVHKDFEPLGGGGGTARHIHGLARALSALGAEVRVIAPEPEEFEQPYRSMHARPRDFSGHVAWADVTHVHGARSSYAVRAAMRSAASGKPFFHTPHAFYEPHGAFNAAAKALWDRSAEKFLLERGAGTILLTDYWRGWLAKRGISTARTTIIPNCILESDLQAVPAAPPALPGSPAILSIGRLDPVKRIDDVIRALPLPGLAEAHLHVVGKGDQRPALEMLAAELGVADRVTFHGFVDDAGAAAMMAGSHVFVLASEQEGLPTVLLEALMAGHPVVCSEIPGNLAITRVAGVDTTFPVGDVERLAALLAQSVSARVGDEPIAALREAFTWEHRAAEILALYEAARSGQRKVA